jgi:hypothetical protein
MNNKIFLISYLGGMHGEFFGNLINNNENFYPSKSLSLKNNKYLCLDVLQQNNICIKLSLNNFNYRTELSNLKLINDDQRLYIDLNYSEKHICALTHIWHEDLQIFNLPRLVPIRLYCNENYIFFTFIMAIIKSWILPTMINESELEFFLSKKDNQNNYYIKTILNRKKYYWVERLALSKNQFNLNLLLNYYYNNIYYRSNLLAKNKAFSNWNYFNIGNLMTNPEQNLKNLKDMFNLNTVDLNTIINYHSANLNIIEKNFNLKYEKLLKSPNRFNIIEEFILSNIEDRKFFN